jgi:short-subunit dehydrogenase
LKTILITGASSGIGYATALLFKSSGYRVFATARDKTDVERLQKMGFDSLILDVTKHTTVNRVFEDIQNKTDSLDIVFNNAGYGQPAALEDITIKLLKEQFETNVFGTHYVNLKSLQIMRKQGFGKIIVHSSILGLISLRFRGAYNASKYALEGLCDTMRLELLDTNIKIITLNTGPVDSKFRENAINRFNQNIDINNSHYKDIYKNRDYNIDSKPDIFTQTSEHAAKIVLKIADAKRVKPRYYITKVAIFLSILKRVLPSSMLDFILRKVE